MRRPGRLFPPPYTGGSGNTQQVDGVRLQVLQEVLGLLSGQLDLGDCAGIATAVGQAVGRDPSTTQLLRERLPGHLDVRWTAAGQAEFRGPEGDCWARTQQSQSCRRQALTTNTHLAAASEERGTPVRRRNIGVTRLAAVYSGDRRGVCVCRTHRLQRCTGRHGLTCDWPPWACRPQCRRCNCELAPDRQ